MNHIFPVFFYQVLSFVASPQKQIKIIWSYLQHSNFFFQWELKKSCRSMVEFDKPWRLLSERKHPRHLQLELISMVTLTNKLCPSTLNCKSFCFFAEHWSRWCCKEKFRTPKKHLTKKISRDLPLIYLIY